MKYLALFVVAGLCACGGNGKTETTVETVQKAVTDVPSREAYEGFEWERVTGAGLSFWSQRNPEIRVMGMPLFQGLLWSVTEMRLPIK